MKDLRRLITSRRCVKRYIGFAVFEATCIAYTVLVVSLIMPHIGYRGFVYAGADASSQRRLNMAFKACLRYIYSLRRLDRVSHLKTSEIHDHFAG
jgi:hypothetical protein